MRSGSGRLGAAGLVAIDQGDAAELDRQERGGGGRFPAGGPIGGARLCIRNDYASSPRGRTRSSARRTWCWPRNIRWSKTSPRRNSAPPVKAYQEAAARKSDLERTELAKKKTGVFTGAYAINPVNQEKIPIWIADYVLATYGTGAIMAVPAHDERDFEFARQFNLPIRTVVRPADEWLKKTGSTLDNLTEAYTERRRRGQLRPVRRSANGGVQEEDHRLAGREAAWAPARSTTSCATGCSAGSATGASRSRSCTRSTPMASRPAWSNRCRRTNCRCACRTWRTYKPSGRPEPPLGKATDWLYVTRNGKRYRRETNTMPQWAGSCWYYLRYIDPHNDKAFCDPRKEKILDAGRPVRRRRRARGPAPALLALLAQGAVRPRPRPQRRSRFRSWSTRA